MWTPEKENAYRLPVGKNAGRTLGSLDDATLAAVLEWSKPRADYYELYRHALRVARYRYCRDNGLLAMSRAELRREVNGGEHGMAAAWLLNERHAEQ